MSFLLCVNAILFSGCPRPTTIVGLWQIARILNRAKLVFVDKMPEDSGSLTCRDTCDVRGTSLRAWCWLLMLVGWMDDWLSFRVLYPLVVWVSSMRSFSNVILAHWASCPICQVAHARGSAERGTSHSMFFEESKALRSRTSNT